MSRVFLPEPNARYGLFDAGDYGEIVYVSRERLNPFDIEYCTEQLVSGLADFDPEHDFICITGSTNTVAVVLAYVTAVFAAPIQLLLFDARESVYRVRVFDPKGMKDAPSISTEARSSSQG